MFEKISNCGIGKFVSHGNWIHPDRVIDSYEMILVTKGEVYLCEEDTSYHIRPNEVLILYPGMRHYGTRYSRDTEFFWLHWYGDAEAFRGFKQKKLENPYAVVEYCRQLLSARIMQKRGEYMDYLTRLAIMEVYLDSNQLSDANPTVEKALAWIKANYRGGITEEQVAAYCQYNVDYLNRVFKSVCGKTIKQYINEKRMEYIKELMLCDNLPLKEIAMRAGFGEYQYFLKFFKYHEKITPTQFYKQHAYLSINSR